MVANYPTFVNILYMYSKAYDFLGKSQKYISVKIETELKAAGIEFNDYKNFCSMIQQHLFATDHADQSGSVEFED